MIRQRKKSKMIRKSRQAQDCNDVSLVVCCLDHCEALLDYRLHLFGVSQKALHLGGAGHVRWLVLCHLPVYSIM